MKTYVIAFIICVLTLCCPWAQSAAQTIITYSDSLLNRPEDIVYDERRCCFYITNHDGNTIVKMDTAGRFSLVLDSINAPTAVALCGDALLISSNFPPTITAMDVNSVRVLYRVNIPEALYFT